MKTNPFKMRVLGIGLFMLCTLQTFSQDNWTLLKEESNVQVFYQSVVCVSAQDLDPLDTEAADDSHDSFQLKIVNNNASSTSVTFSKITKMDDSDELNTIMVPSGTTLLETCGVAPKLILTKQEGDQYPIAFTDFLNEFILTIQI